VPRFCAAARSSPARRRTRSRAWARKGLRLLAQARDATGLGVVTEVLKPEDVDLIAEYADMLQVGARNMQNFALLKRWARSEAVPLEAGHGVHHTRSS